jgi:hypothetical protein
MGQELQAVGAIRSMLSARTAVEVALAKDVGWLLEGRKLSSIRTLLATAASDARVGADALATDLPDAATRLREAAGVLDGVRELGVTRSAWDAARPEVGRARDLLEETIVEARTSLAPQRQEQVAEVRSLYEAWRTGGKLDGDQWARLTELAELPVGLRPASLEHVSSGDLKLLREQAQRMREGLGSTADPRLHDIMFGVGVTHQEPTRETVEASMRTIAAGATALVGVDGSKAELASHLGTVAAMQGLDSTVRPRMLARTANVDWSGAAALLRDGATVPPSWEGFRALRGITYLEHPQPALEELLTKQPEAFTATDWRMLADMVRLPAGERPAALAGFSKKAAREMESAARMVTDGITVPSSWKGFSRVNQLRANVLWSAPGPATEHLSSIMALPPGDVTKAHLSDLDALRQLPDGIRPDILDPNETLFAELATSPQALSHAENAEKLGRFTALSLKLKTPDELRITLDRVDEHVAELERIQEHWSQEAPRGVLNSFGADLRLLRGFELDDTVKRLIGETSGLFENNVNRLDGKVGGGYGRHVDYADMGRIKENVRLFTELARDQALGESNTIAHARQAAAAEAAAAAVPEGAAAEATEVLSW